MNSSYIINTTITIHFPSLISVGSRESTFFIRLYYTCLVQHYYCNQFPCANNIGSKGFSLLLPFWLLCQENWKFWQCKFLPLSWNPFTRSHIFSTKFSSFCSEFDKGRRLVAHMFCCHKCFCHIRQGLLTLYLASAQITLLACRN